MTITHLNNVIVGIGKPMTKEQTNHFANMIREGKGKQALDIMIEQSFSKKDIYDFYDRINFYPNSETQEYIQNRFSGKL